MSYELADSERAGIASLCTDLRKQGCRADTIAHVREVLTARCCAINSMAARLRQRENDVEVFRGMFEREAAAHQETLNRITALLEADAARERREEGKDAL